jgi:4-hydroxybenzoate polyprenyltransferase
MGGLFAALLIIAPLGLVSVVLAMVGAGAGVLYNLYFKATAWSWVPYLVALPLLPIWVWTTVRGWDGWMLSFYPMGMLTVIGLHLADTLPDIQADTEHGIRGFAHRLGERRTLLMCWLSSLVPPLLAITLAAAGLAAMRYVAPATFLSLLLIGLAITYYSRAQRPDWRPHFALLGVAAITLGVGWLLALYYR